MVGRPEGGDVECHGNPRMFNLHNLHFYKATVSNLPPIFLYFQRFCKCELALQPPFCK